MDGRGEVTALPRSSPPRASNPQNPQLWGLVYTWGPRHRAMRGFCSLGSSPLTFLDTEPEPKGWLSRG